MKLNAQLICLLCFIALNAARGQEREWHIQSPRITKTMQASLWAYNAETGFVALKPPATAPLVSQGTFLGLLKDLSEEDQTLVKAAKISDLPAKSGFPADPDLLGFKLRMSSDEILTLLKKDGYKVEMTSKEEPASVIAVRSAATARGEKPAPQQPGSVISSISAHKLEDAGQPAQFQSKFLFNFVEDISVNPPVAKCHRISYNKIFINKAIDTGKARVEMKQAVLEKYGTPVFESRGAYYTDGPGGGGDGADENAPDFRSIDFRLSVGDIIFNDTGFQRQKLGLRRKLIGDAAKAAKPVPEKRNCEAG